MRSFYALILMIVSYYGIAVIVITDSVCLFHHRPIIKISLTWRMLEEYPISACT